MPRHDTSFGLESADGPSLTGTPFPWFDRESYPRVLEAMVDHDLLPATYDQWLKQALRVLDKSRREGQRPIRAHIDPEKFLGWCQENDWPADGMARLAYAGYVARLNLLPDETGARRLLTEYET